jgi:hypothetical protein
MTRSKPRDCCCCCFSVCRTFLANREAAVDFLNTVDRVYIVDGFANWDPEVSLLLGVLYLSLVMLQSFNWVAQHG